MTERRNPADRMVWIDTETTGLHHRRDLLLEIAVIVTGADLNELGVFQEVIHQPRDRVMQLMDRDVLRMHTNSGLIADLARTTAESRTPLVEQRVIEFLAEHGALNAVVAGNNVSGFDRRFLGEVMRDLNDHALHYRCVDVSTVKEIARGRAPEVFASAPAKVGRHRALDDIRESIAEYRHYCDNGLFTVGVVVPKPVDQYSFVEKWADGSGVYERVTFADLSEARRYLRDNADSVAEFNAEADEDGDRIVAGIEHRVIYAPGPWGPLPVGGES